MDPNIGSVCGCKGIRTCLICEKDKGSPNSAHGNKTIVHYSYCPHCNLCWSLDKKESPLFLGKLMIALDFLSEDEEIDTITSIDKINWVPSQSGRKKQDFGPKVNFKKKKSKTGNFKGFPIFSKNIIQRLQKHEDLSDFQPVELCHLEYMPDRGSAIEPHIDDAWIWGERLVTVNLVSDTTLTLTPANNNNCDCSNLKSLDLSNVQQLNCSHSLVSKEDVKDACNMYRMPESNVKLEVSVLLPRRSLFVLSGCSRHNWYHEVKRKEITSRRLAMTFRELSEIFQKGGKEEKMGNELLVLGKTFCEHEL